MKLIILCGGQGTRLREETEYKPKPMVEIGGKPILWHIMHTYASHGYTEFVLALGYKGSVIKDYFLNYRFMHSDFTVNLSNGEIIAHPNSYQVDWKVTLVDTGEESQKGARLAKVASHITEERFMVTYGDGISDININHLVEYHKKADTIGTFTGVRMPSRFGTVQTDAKGNITSWQEKPLLEDYTNAGFFVFKRAFLDYLSEEDDCDLEKEPLEKLATENQLTMYRHEGFWACMDTYRDSLHLNAMWDSGNRPWMKN